MGYRVKGTLKLPDGSPASNAEIEFISRKNFSPLVQELKSNILCGPSGAYDVTLEFGEYAVMVYPGGTYPAALGTIVLAADTVAGQDLPTLLQQSGWQPATPEYIQQIAAWLAEANASATSSAASASAAKVSETNAKASENAALSSKNSAASSASTATTKAAEAASSASAALASKNAAATSEANALASKNSAATSATTASAGASTATTKAGEASASATAAKASQDAARVSETNAAASASAAASAIVTHEGKAGAHPISGVTGLQAALDGKYSPANKPTAADVGALPITGGTMTGSVSVDKDGKTATFGTGSTAVYIRNSKSNKYIQLKDNGTLSYSDQAIYHEGFKPTAADIQNVVSPVSAGGIIERGSNANGEYVKFADGTMICTAAVDLPIAVNIAWGSIFRGAHHVVAYPHQFIDLPITSSKVSLNWLPCWIAYGGEESSNRAYTSLMLASGTSFYSSESNIVGGYIAVGRWK